MVYVQGTFTVDGLVDRAVVYLEDFARAEARDAGTQRRERDGPRERTW